MKNKVELKKSIIISILAVILISIVFVIFKYYQYKVYTNNFNDKIGSIITKLTQEYPNINQNDLMEIINSKEDINTDIFKRYGIELDEDSIVLKNKQNFVKFLIEDLIILLGLSVVLLVVFFRYNKNKENKINEITRYIEEINNRNYKLYIEDNTEDELSILKNEIYKTTVMLNEMAENSIQDKMKLKESLSDISHQLKTPLTSITIMLDNILENPQMEETIRIEFIKDIKREIININFLVNSLLKLSRLEANAVKFINKEENIEKIIAQSIRNVATLCDLKNIQIRTKGSQDYKIYCDSKWQIEAITNILKNAIEHSDIDSAIDIIYKQNEVYSKIQIKDYGVGIEEEDINHIFERFYKGKNSNNDSIGIGLALSKSIIENNGGYIEVESEKNKGTIFTIKYFK